MRVIVPATAGRRHFDRERLPAGEARVEAGDELISIAKGLALIGAREDAARWSVAPAARAD